jgi:hypothetical protein
MRSTLEKISWATRKWNYEFELFGLQLSDRPGFNLFTICINHEDHSLLSFKFRLPNKANIKNFTIDDWDILFARNYLWNQFDDLSDSKTWGAELSKWNKAKLHFLSKLFN